MQTQEHSALLVAGGVGARLSPITSIIPKPLLPIGSTTPIESILSGIDQTNPREIVIATGYRGALIEAYVRALELRTNIRFMREDRPLGTAGPIASLQNCPELLLVCNCDIITDISFQDVLVNHVSKQADFTIVAVEDQRELPYGRLSISNDGSLIEWSERETLRRLVCAGIYVITPVIASLANHGEYLDMHTLASRVLEHHFRATVYVHRGTWVDLGNLKDYEKAQRLFNFNSFANIASCQDGSE